MTSLNRFGVFIVDFERFSYLFYIVSFVDFELVNVVWVDDVIVNFEHIQNNSHYSNLESYISLIRLLTKSYLKET